MTPAAHWTPADYYIAVGRARAAWERSQPQLVLGLEGADAGTTSLVASAPSSPNDGLAAAEREGVLETVRTVGLPCSAAASPPNPAADAARTSGSHSSGRGEGGLENPTTRETPWA